MPDEKPSQTGVTDLTESLTEGIESCRSVIANYKSLLSGDTSQKSTAQVEDKSEHSTALARRKDIGAS